MSSTKSRTCGSAGSADRASPNLGGASIRSLPRGGPFQTRHASVPFNKSKYNKIPEFRERPTTYFKASQEFLNAAT